jgi:hypothetical protein
MKKVKLFTEETFYYEGKETRNYGKTATIELPGGYNLERLTVHYSEEQLRDEIAFEKEIDVSGVEFFIFREYYGGSLEYVDEILYIIPSNLGFTNIFRKEWIPQITGFLYRDKFLYVEEATSVIVLNPGHQNEVLDVPRISNNRELRKVLKKRGYIR